MERMGVGEGVIFFKEYEAVIKNLALGLNSTQPTGEPHWASSVASSVKGKE